MIPLYFAVCTILFLAFVLLIRVVAKERITLEHLVFFGFASYVPLLNVWLFGYILWEILKPVWYSIKDKELF